jgi:hypothetical protein
MAEINLSKYGITGTTEIVYNPSYETLFEEETKPELEGYEQGRKFVANRQFDEECYVEFIKILIADNKIVLAEDIAGKALREYPTMRETLNKLLESSEKNAASEKN